MTTINTANPPLKGIVHDLILEVASLKAEINRTLSLYSINVTGNAYVGGLSVLNGGVEFATVGGIPSILNDYETTGPVPSIFIFDVVQTESNVTITRIGNIIVLSWDAIAFVSSNTGIVTLVYPLIDLRFMPIHDYTFSTIPIISDSLPGLGIPVIYSDGVNGTLTFVGFAFSSLGPNPTVEPGSIVWHV